MNSLLIVEAKSLRLPATTKPGWAAAPKKATFAIGSCWCYSVRVNIWEPPRNMVAMWKIQKKKLQVGDRYR